MPNNLYEILEIDKNADTNEIKKSYRKLARKWHPDKNNQSEESQEKFKKINEAYAVLSDPQKRRQYDMGGGIFSDVNPFDIFSHFFNVNKSNSPFQNNNSANIIYELKVPLEKLCKDKSLKITYERNNKCSQCEGKKIKKGHSFKTCNFCNGRGIANQPVHLGPIIIQQAKKCGYCNGAGKILPEKYKCECCNGDGIISEQIKNTFSILSAFENKSLKFLDLGHYDINSGTFGLLLIKIKIDCNNSKFTVQGYDLKLNLSISFLESLQGNRWIINHPSGIQIEINNINSPKIIEPNKTYVVQSYGIKGEKNVGNLLVNFSINNYDKFDVDTLKEIRKILDNKFFRNDINKKNISLSL